MILTLQDDHKNLDHQEPGDDQKEPEDDQKESDDSNQSQSSLEENKSDDQIPAGENIEDKLDKKLVEMWKSEPVLNPEQRKNYPCYSEPEKALQTWRKIGPLDLNEIHKKSPIDFNQELVMGD